MLFALAIPFWLIGAVARGGLPVPMNLPVSALQAFCPLMAASILVYREDKLGGVGRLLKRAFDYRSIKQKIWYAPIFFLLPTIYLLSYETMRLLKLPLPAAPHVLFLTIPVLLVVFFVAAVGEEAGWTGYALDPMQDRWSALTAGIVLGAVWGVFHAIPDIQANHGPAWIAWQHGVYAVALRILIVWLYNNTAKSVFAAVIVHDTDNVSWSLFPNFGSHYDSAVTGAIAAVAATIVTFLWSAKTLARYRYAGSR